MHEHGLVPAYRSLYREKAKRVYALVSLSRKECRRDGSVETRKTLHALGLVGNRRMKTVPSLLHAVLLRVWGCLTKHGTDLFLLLYLLVTLYHELRSTAPLTRTIGVFLFFIVLLLRWAVLWHGRRAEQFLKAKNNDAYERARTWMRTTFQLLVVSTLVLLVFWWFFVLRLAI